MPVFEKNTLAQAATYLSKELEEPFLVDDVESIIVEGSLVACVWRGEQLSYIFGDSFKDLKNGRPTLVAESREDLMNGWETVLRQYGPIEYKSDDVVILKEDLDAFIARKDLGEASEASLAKLPKPLVPEKAEGVPLAPVPRFEAQDRALLTALANAGYNPENLPANTPGKPGVRAEMKNVLVGTKLFTEYSFLHAWKRLSPSYVKSE